MANRLTEDPNRRALLLEARGEDPTNSRISSNWVTMFNTEHYWS